MIRCTADTILSGKEKEGWCQRDLIEAKPADVPCINECPASAVASDAKAPLSFEGR